MNTTITLITTVLIGLIAGSFLNVVILRYPKMLAKRWEKDCREYLKQATQQTHRTDFNLITPRSRCPKCFTQLKAWHNIPLISYLFLRGRCAFCKKTISLRYPVIELLTAIVSVITVIHFGIGWQGVFAVILSWGLITLSIIDFDTQLLPDDLTLSFLWIGLVTNTFSFYTIPSSAILGAFIGYFFLWIIAKLFTLMRKKTGMGHGDFKMFAMLGAWMGISLLLNILLTAVLVALIVSLTLIIFKKISTTKSISFGPYLALGGWFSFLYGPTTTNWITRMLL